MGAYQTRKDGCKPHVPPITGVIYTIDEFVWCADISVDAFQNVDAVGESSNVCKTGVSSANIRHMICSSDKTGKKPQCTPTGCMLAPEGGGQDFTLPCEWAPPPDCLLCPVPPETSRKGYCSPQGQSSLRVHCRAPGRSDQCSRDHPSLSGAGTGK